MPIRVQQAQRTPRVGYEGGAESCKMKAYTSHEGFYQNNNKGLEGN